MRKALVTLVKRMILGSTTTDNEILLEALNSSQLHIEARLEMSQNSNYSLSTDGLNLGVKKIVDTAATIGSLNSLFKLKGAIPDLWDTAHCINLKSASMAGQLPNIRVEVIEFVKGEKDKLSLAVYFETESLVLLDSIADKLLLAFPLTEETDNKTRLPFTDTFFLKLTDDIFFGAYTELRV